MSYDIENIYTYHAPQCGQTDKYEELRAQAKRLAYLINAICPASHEKVRAMDKLEESVMLANASIARNE